VDAASEEVESSSRPVLDNDYEIKPCQSDPQEDPSQNQADAERARGRVRFSAALGRRARPFAVDEPIL
jgi:hypothetical protein